jgi:hypothetical protein
MHVSLCCVASLLFLFLFPLFLSAAGVAVDKNGVHQHDVPLQGMMQAKQWSVGLGLRRKRIAGGEEEEAAREGRGGEGGGQWQRQRRLGGGSARPVASRRGAAITGPVGLRFQHPRREGWRTGRVVGPRP